VAPERLAGATASGATDIYALGVLLFEALTGVPPFAANTWHELESASRQIGPIEVPGLPAPVAAICRRCLAIDPAERPSAEEVADRLSGIAASPRRRWWIPLAAVLAAVAAFFLVLAGNGGIKGALTSPARSGSPAQSPIGAPPPSQAPVEVPAGPPSTAPATPSRTARSSPAAPTVGDATAAVYAVLDRRGAAGDIRPDVVEDVRNLVDALVANPAEPQPRVDGLRQQLRARQREHAMTPDALAELDAAITVLANSLTRAPQTR
jgi:serine/threonine-protein kinase